jgi:uncharacterized repeat protein (TIGR03803 family)
VTLALALAVALTLFASLPAHAQTYKVIYNFTGGADGVTPMAGLAVDRGGNLYGTASAGGSGYGTVFRLHHAGSGWVFSSLYAFQGGADGQTPMGAVTVGPDGSLYGTTEFGGPTHSVCYIGCGTVFNLKPPPTRPVSAFSPWVKTIIYPFSFGDGAFPLSEVIFDAAGNLYGTTYGGELGGDCDGAPCSSCGFNCGMAYELTPTQNGWVNTVLFNFNDDTGSNPSAGLVFDNAGNLYGVTPAGGLGGLGTVFQLVPSASGWTEATLHFFQGKGDGGGAAGTLAYDSVSGLLHGGGPGFYEYPGTVFQCASSGNFLSNYTFGIGDGPSAGVTVDTGGNLYGTTTQGGAYNWGFIFKLSPSGGGWIFTDLHDFQGGSDGCGSKGKVLVDAAGSLYGTGPSCGANGKGTVWEITP